MGASASKIEEDKALQLCRERKKFVKQALHGRCSLAAAHVTYVQSLRNTGTALKKFAEPQAPVESSLYTSTNATPEPLVLTEKSPSGFSLSSPTLSNRVDANEPATPSPSPPNSIPFQVNHMKFWGSSSKKVEEKVSIPVVRTVTSSVTCQNTAAHSAERSDATLSQDPVLAADTAPWDYFGMSHPIDHQFSIKERKQMDQELEGVDCVTQMREDANCDFEDQEKFSSRGSEGSQDSDDEFDDPSGETLIRRFVNVTRLPQQAAPSASPTTPSARTIASENEYMNDDKTGTPDLSPLGNASSTFGDSLQKAGTQEKEDCVKNNIAPKDFFSSLKDIEYLFLKASESGKEVPRMLEANKLHFRPIFPGKERKSIASTVLKACFSCGDDPVLVQEEPPQADIKYLTWHRTTSSRSASSRNLLGVNSKDDMDDLSGNIFDNICMFSGSHASTLDRLYAWERKLYDEVKASEMIRKEYDKQCRILRQLESKELNSKIYKTRAVVKDLHSRIIVAIQRIDSISKKIEELRDRELQPQLEELIEGLRRMWEVMFECHKLQFQIISGAYNNGSAKITIWSESHQQITIHLENELSSLSSSFAKWISAQKSYVEHINGWLCKCVTFPQKSSKRNKRAPPPRLRDFGPPIYVTCDVWLEKLAKLPTKEVAYSIKRLAMETARFVPHQEKSQVKNTNLLHLSSWKADNNSDLASHDLRDEASEDLVSGFDRFQSSLEDFIRNLNTFAEHSLRMYGELQKSIQEAKHSYEMRSQSQS